ncbi:hypothetical protein M2R28_02395 [Aeromonas hydrophila]|uniref:hypothetical protein n=1 Tax=Aeromonas hydrophila TaxID=644 RepID=UPI001A1E74C4|nr:hypothetical protein [Aeromonas hydrophila]MCO4198537.1 hypothetical protein [Aeromonas hydrophila]HAU4887426.1 hypothetical protein [Aeromonas hydrophila]HEB5077495.1 hypothetical protein [Aeromonas hydrophila subsp. hydrophila]
MIDAISYRKIVESVNKELTSMPKRIMFFDSAEPAAERAMAKINSATKKHSLVAVLFCNPRTEFCKKEILESLNYLHHRSGNSINIFCCGYGAYWPQYKYPDLECVTKIDGVDWYYSDNAFVSVIKEFEEKTSWRYSGENELILLDVIPSVDENDLNINNALVCNLEKMKKDEAFSSVRALFEKLIRYCSTTEAADAWTFSDTQGLSIAKNLLKDTVLSFLPKHLQSSYNKAESYVITKI